MAPIDEGGLTTSSSSPWTVLWLALLMTASVEEEGGEVVGDEDTGRGGDDRRVHGAADTRGAARGVHAEEARIHGDHDAVEEGLHDADPEVPRVDHRERVVEVLDRVEVEHHVGHAHRADDREEVRDDAEQ